jgi:hypothetical protein
MADRRRDVLRIRVSLEDILPPIWREILVPAHYSFWDLHVAIQDAMGWLDCHLHEFSVPEGQTPRDLRIGIPDEEQWPGTPTVLAGWEYPVLDLLREPGQSLCYLYDFGDDWLHSVTLLAIERREKGQRYPQCVAGERACPPEDCGGAHGYQALLQALFDPAHPGHAEMHRWIPEGWGPELFRPGEVQFDSPRKRWELAFLFEE